MSLLEIISEIESIRTKRNTAMTIIESSDIIKTINHIKKQIQCIKHQSKRGQLLQIYNILEKNVLMYIKATNKKTGIFCIGEKTDGQIYYKEINIVPPYSSYDYDDIFHTFKISQILFNFQIATDKEIKNLEERFYANENQDPAYHYGTKYWIGEQIDLNLNDIKTIYHITKTVNPTNVPHRWLGKDIKIIFDYVSKGPVISPLSICQDIGIP
jgi:hypothetical protein